MESYYVTLNHIITFNFQSLIMRISSLNHSHLEQTCTNISYRPVRVSRTLSSRNLWIEPNDYNEVNVKLPPFQ